MKKNKIIDLFCGCGGMSLGFEQAGFEVELAIDFWKDAIVTYNANRDKKVAVCDDIKNLSNETLQMMAARGEIVGVIGGPPCQGFSTVGRREINDPRNQLYLQYCRIVEQIQPDFFVLENVKGLITLSEGMFRDDIVNRFGALGYNVTYKVLNAADYGVPQNRERVFFVGIKNKPFQFPEGDHEHQLSSKDGLSDLPLLNDTDGFNEVYEYALPPQNKFQRSMRIGSDGVYNHQITAHSDQTKSIIGMIPDGGKIRDLPPEYWSIRKYNKAFERMSSVRPSNTVDTGHRNYFHYSENRIPTARENARLQSFPDNFHFVGTKTSQYKQIGNAVPPMLAKVLAESIKAQLM